MPYLDINEAKIYYEDYGRGQKTLVFIPGIGASTKMYEPQINFFKQTFRVITLDLRGNGASSKLNIPVRDTIQKQASDVIELLRELDIPKSYFIGVSYGGIVCQTIAFTYPNSVKGLIVVDSFYDTRIRYLGLKYKWASYMAVPFYLLPRKNLAKLAESTYNDWPTAQKSMKQVILNMRRWELIKQRIEVNRIKYEPYLKHIRAPTLIITGDKMPQHWAKKLLESIENSKLVVIKDSFDPSNLCRPNEFNQSVFLFVS
ncbi:alpha/beta hydrolase [Bacillus sp. SM2101]|uniref:alpha/beta fold hydrolase n=1 Tax=Bacillus sp. SM2101 TaxID=2805366 RepID=UPI001BDE1F26|nr:alpha/beta hydrolase [Bacillus sp. SM2101]